MAMASCRFDHRFQGYGDVGYWKRGILCNDIFGTESAFRTTREEIFSRASCVLFGDFLGGDTW